MNQYDVIRLALVLAVQSEIEGMKAENIQRKCSMHSLAYNEDDFQEKSEELRRLAYCHNEQL